MDGSRYLLDTSAIIALQRENESLKQRLSIATDVFLPVVAVGELYYGAYRSQRGEHGQEETRTTPFTERTGSRENSGFAGGLGQLRESHVWRAGR